MDEMVVGSVVVPLRGGGGSGIGDDAGGGGGRKEGHAVSKGNEGPWSLCRKPADLTFPATTGRTNDGAVSSLLLTLQCPMDPSGSGGCLL